MTEGLAFPIRLDAIAIAIVIVIAIVIAIAIAIGTAIVITIAIAIVITIAIGGQSHPAQHPQFVGYEIAVTPGGFIWQEDQSEVVPSPRAAWLWGRKKPEKRATEAFQAGIRIF